MRRIIEGANLNGAIAAGAYFGQSLLDVGSLENADFTDASIPIKTLPQVCARDDVKGTNPTTGVVSLLLIFVEVVHDAF